MDQVQRGVKIGLGIAIGWILVQLILLVFLGIGWVTWVFLTMPGMVLGGG